MPEEVQLPGGLVLDDRHRLESAELCPLTGRDEEWLATHSTAPSAIAVTRILTSCLVRIGDTKPTEKLVRRLLVGDRDFLILQLRRLTLGDEFHVVFPCTACGNKMDVIFGADRMPVTVRPQTRAEYSIQLGLPGNSGTTVRFRLPCGADQEAVVHLKPERAADMLLDRCVLETGGKSFSIADRETIADAMEELAPQVDLELDLVCPDCGNQFLAPFDTTAFFLNEMRVSSVQLLREIHSLAFYYHWSQAEILGLRRDRRRTYLGLLSEALRQE
jgi:predicted RNA-binding Zn-ribbon protein involved in translation (DUF1610 family)